MAGEVHSGMRPLFILSLATGYGGAERSIETIVRHLPHGLPVRIYAAHDEHIRLLTEARRDREDVRISRLSAASTLLARRIAALRFIADIRRHDPRVILINTHAGALIAAMAAKAVPDLGRRCFLFVRDYLWDDLDYIFERLEGARVLVPHSSVAGRNGYLAPFHIGPFAAPWAESPDMVEIPDKPVSFGGPMLHLATINPWKGHADLMLAVHRLAAVNPRLTVRSAGIVGNRGLLDRLTLLAGRLDLGERFTLQPYAADPAPLLASCRAVIVTSVSHSGGPESFGRTIIEAWAHRKPVIAYAAGAPGAIVEHEHDGLLVREGDVGALADALNRLDRSPDLAQRLGAAGHGKARQHYEAGAVTRRLLETLGIAP